MNITQSHISPCLLFDASRNLDWDAAAKHLISKLHPKLCQNQPLAQASHCVLGSVATSHQSNHRCDQMLNLVAFYLSAL
jgi:hypothetical protein